MPNKTRLTDDNLIRFVPESLSYMEVIRKCGLKATGGGTNQMIKQRIKELGIDVSHFRGQGWRQEGCRPTHIRELNEILVENSDYRATYNLKLRLWKEKILEKKCSRCNSIDWFGRVNHLQLDHINGIRSDNRLENLRILCANCHSLTDTWCGKNTDAHVAQLVEASDSSPDK